MKKQEGGLEYAKLESWRIDGKAGEATGELSGDLRIKAPVLGGRPAAVPPLKKEWDDSLNALAVDWVLIGELLQHQFFFAAGFDPETYEHEDESN